jgi:hypothetical protein
MAMVLKTIVAATSPWVRIPRPPLLTRHYVVRQHWRPGISPAVSGRYVTRMRTRGQSRVTCARLTRSGSSCLTFSVESWWICSRTCWYRSCVIRVVEWPGYSATILDADARFERQCRRGVPCCVDLITGSPASAASSRKWCETYSGCSSPRFNLNTINYAGRREGMGFLESARCAGIGCSTVCNRSAATRPSTTATARGHQLGGDLAGSAAEDVHQAARGTDRHRAEDGRQTGDELDGARWRSALGPVAAVLDRARGARGVQGPPTSSTSRCRHAVGVGHPAGKPFCPVRGCSVFLSVCHARIASA